MKRTVEISEKNVATATYGPQPTVMNWISVNHLNLLKAEVSSVSGIVGIAPGDCKRLSVEIQRKTNKSISETTLKRIYGFASTRFNPSSFTLNSLSEYCGYRSWDDFMENAKTGTETRDTSYWSKLSDEAIKITNYTLQLLKNRSGIPFSSTVPRRFLNDHLEIFMNEDYSGTIITAPSGYGKTIALCHWVDAFIQRNESATDKDLLLLISGSVLISGVNGFQEVSEWISAFSGLSSNDIYRRLPDYLELTRGRFFLVIDGLDSHFNNHQFNTLFNQLHELAILYCHSDRIKIIVTMRTFNWSAVKNNLTRENGWFSGFMNGHAGERNVPLLDYYEILKITGNTNLTSLNQDKLHRLEVLCFPLYLQYFFDTASGRFDLENISELSIYELVSMHVYHKIYLSNSSNEMMMVLDELIGHMDLKKGDYVVNKLQIGQVVKKLSRAYHELLDIGFLLEHNESNTYRYTLNIRVENAGFLALAIAKKMLFANQDRFDEALVTALNDELGEEIRFEVVKWSIYLSLGNKQPFPMRFLDAFGFNIRQKLDIAGFLDQLFRKELHSNPDQLEVLVTDVSIAHFFGIGIIQAGYNKSLETVLNLKLPANEKIMMHTCLGVVALIALDMTRLENEINELARFPDPELSEFRINPHNCLVAAHYYLKHGIVPSELHNELNKIALDATKQKIDASDFREVLVILLVRVLVICKMPDEAVKCISEFRRLLPDGSAIYSYMLSVTEAEALLSLGDGQSVRQICRNLESSFGKKSGRTELMDVYLQSLRIRLIALTEEPLLSEISSVIKRCDNASFLLVRANLQAFLLERCEALRGHEQEYNAVYYSLVKLLHQVGVRVESILNR